MQRRQCGRTDLCLPALGMGCWAFGGGEYWGAQDQTDVNRTVRRALELGVNYFDTAEAYNDGRSEESLGLAIRDLPREQLLIGTKISPGNAESETLYAHCEASLRRLGTDYIDLYMVHWPILPHSIVHFSPGAVCPSPPAAFAALLNLQRQGKIRYIGVSNFGVEVLDEAWAAGAQIAVNELPYNLLCRAIECEILPHCRDTGVGVLGYIALMQGLLADSYPTLDDVPLWRRRTRHFSRQRAGEYCRHGGDGAEAETNQALAAIRKIAAERHSTMRELAIAWALAREGISCTLVGARNEQQLEANVLAAARPLEPEVVARLDEATTPLLRKLGPGFDYYESASNDRTRPLRSV